MLPREESGVGLHVAGVTVRFGGLTALDNVSLDVAPGEIVGVIGPNGAGKTTLFNVICGFVRPQHGEISWNQHSLGRIKPHQLGRRGIVRTLQGVGLFSGLTVLENVMVGAEPVARAGFTSNLLGLPRSDRDERALRARAMETLDRLQVAEVAERLPGTLPYPVQKRVAMARALVAEPELLLLDEPASGLGGADMEGLAEVIRDLRSRAAVMLVEHHMDFVTGICERIVVLDFGRVIATGPPAQIQADPRVLEAYLGFETSAQDEAREPEADRA